MDQSGSNKGLVIAVGILAAIAILVCIVLGVMQYNAAQTISSLEATVSNLEQTVVNTTKVNTTVSNSNTNTATTVVNTNTASTNVNTNATVDTEDSTLKTFESADLGISFSYPNTFTVTTQNVFGEWYRVTVEDKTNAQNPSMVLEVNADGMDFFPNKIYTLAETAGGKLSITKEATDTIVESSDEFLMVGSSVEASNGNTYFWHYSYELGSEDLESIFKSVLTSTQFTK